MKREKNVHRHAHGYLTTKIVGDHKPLSKNVRDRIKRWAKRVLKREDSVELEHERDTVHQSPEG